VVRAILLYLALLWSPASLAAQEDPAPQLGTLTGSLTIAPGQLLQHDAQLVYLHGWTEFFFADRMAVRTDGFLFVDEIAGRAPISTNHSGYLGLTYHTISGGPWDVWLGLAPGFHLVRTEASSSLLPTPALRSSAGVGYFLGHYFHFFAQLGISTARAYGPHGAIRLDEVRASAGLGFELDLGG
jgi:hypothetical protein